MTVRQIIITMQWLNKVDDALDWVLGPSSTQPNDAEEEEEEEGSSNSNSDQGGAARRQQRRRLDVDDENAAAAAAAAAAAVIINDNNNNSAKARVKEVATNRAVTVNNASTKARPPPPPPPGRPIQMVAPPPPLPPPPPATRTATKNAHSSLSSLPSDTSHHLSPPPMTTVPTNNLDGKSSITAESESKQITTTPLLLQIQDLARASPAPSKVTIGDRQPLQSESLFTLKLPDLDLQQQSDNENDEIGGADAAILLPPTSTTLRSTLSQAEMYIGDQSSQWEQQPTTSSFTLHRSRQQHEPPSPSTFVIHLPTNTTTQQEDDQLPPPLPPIPHPPMIGHINLHTAAATARSAATTRATPRPIPGVIRRKLREPSLSPPDSPSQSLSGSTEEDAIPSRILSVGDDEINSSMNEIVERHDDAPMTVVDWFKRMGSRDGKDEVNVRGIAEHNNHADDAEHDDVAFSEDGSFHSQTSTDNSELTESNMLDDFALPSPLSSPVENDEQDNNTAARSSSWDPSLNCYGFFHLRLLRAQRLPCPVGSSINATISLQPWNGRIRVPAHSTIEGPEGAGVCLRWDKRIDPKRGGGSGDRGRLLVSPGSKAEESPEKDDPCSHSMVHAYNNEDTPVPTIVVELSITSLGGVFDRFLCYIAVPCHDLMRNPRSWRHKWHPASLIQGVDTPDDIENAPLILLETCFEPMMTKVNPEQIIFTTDVTDDADTANVSGDSDTLGSIPNIIRPQHRRGLIIDDDNTSKSSTLTPALVPRSSSISKTHLLRVRSFWTPTWCAVCSQSILSGWVKGKSYECEECRIFCCRDCHLQVDARIPCGSELAAIAVKKAQQYQLPSLGQIMSTLAPDVGGSMNVAAGVRDSAINDRENASLNVNTMLPHTGGSIQGIGIIHVRVLRACLFDKTFPPEADPNVVFQSDTNLHNGDHYVRISWLGSKESKRTKTVLQTPKPNFDSDVMVFDVPHYGMEYKLEVVDANTDKPIGSCLLSTQGLLQWQRDDMFAQTDRILLSLFHLRKYSEPRRVKLELRTGVKDGFGLNFYNSSEVVGSSTNKGKQSAQRPGEISGWLEIDVLLEEDRSLFYSMNPRRCPPKADEEFDIALIQLHIARITAITEFVQNLVYAYMHVVSWENPQLTGMSMVRFLSTSLALVINRMKFNMSAFDPFEFR
jgi:hypothetical protein